MQSAVFSTLFIFVLYSIFELKGALSTGCCLITVELQQESITGSGHVSHQVDENVN